MKEKKFSRLSGQYLAALRSHVEHGPQAGLQAAHEVGCLAVSIGLETLDLARIHEQAMATLVMPDCAATVQNEMTMRAAAFFAEAMTPIEKTHRTALAAIADLNQVNATLARRTMDLEDSNRELQRGIALRKVAVDSLEVSENQSATLLEEAGQLQKHLQDMARQILSTQEDERKTMSLKLQDEIAQTLLGIQMRLLALDKELSFSTEDFKKEIANTQRLVEKSVKTINRFARDLGIQHEE
jgi:signal transduction histidine kinase